MPQKTKIILWIQLYTIIISNFAPEKIDTI